MDHGIFQPANNERKGRWLENNKTFLFYGIRDGEELRYAKRHQQLKVKLLDGTIRTLMTDISLSVREIIDNIGENLRIKNPEEYSFINMNTKKWLSSRKGLREQGIENDDVVVFAKKYYITDESVDKSDPVQLSLIYEQCQRALVGGRYPCSLEDSETFAGYQLQIEHGNYEKRKEKIIKLEAVLPKSILKKASTKTIFKNWDQLAGSEVLDVKYRYVQLCRSLETYGVAMFPIKEQTKKGKVEDFYVGLTKQYILRMEAETRKIIEKTPILYIKKWSSNPNQTFTFDFGDKRDSHWIVKTPSGDDIAQWFTGFFDILLKRKRLAQKEKEIDNTDEAETEDIGPEIEQSTVGQSKVITVGGYQPNMFGEEDGGANNGSLLDEGEEQKLRSESTSRRRGKVLTESSGKTPKKCFHFFFGFI